MDQIWKNKVTCSTSSVRRHIRIFQYSISSCLSKALVDALEDGDGAVKFIVKTKPVAPGRRSLVSVARFQTAAPETWKKNIHLKFSASIFAWIFFIHDLRCFSKRC